MNIFLVIHPSGNIAVPGSMTWYKNLYEPLIDIGHQVYFFNLEDYLKRNKFTFRSQSYKSKLSEELISVFERENKKKQFNFILTYLTDRDIEVNAIQKLKRFGLPIANFSCNNTHQFHLIKNISPQFDFNLHSEKDSATKFLGIGAKPVWFQMAANPKYYYPMDVVRDIDVSFVGMNYAIRAKYLAYLFNNGVKTECFGPGWLQPSFSRSLRKEIKITLFKMNNILARNKERIIVQKAFTADHKYKKEFLKKYRDHLHQPVGENDLIKIYNRSKVNLGFLEVFAKDNDASKALTKHLHLREFEIPMCGGLYITNYSDELAEHYEPDKEVIIFNDEVELLEKVKFYLKNTAAADKVRKAGYRRAISEHTYQQRFKDLFKRIGLKE